ncbi:MAG: hypothetical protein WCP85_00410 [Mariniphaga sp.]
MRSFKGLLKPNTRITLGIIWFTIAIIYIADRFMGKLVFRLFDWIGFFAMFSAGAISLLEGIKSKKAS